jgi:hypothetical protein
LVHYIAAAPVIRTSDRNYEPKFATPISPHALLNFATTTGRLIRAVNISRNFKEIGEKVGNVRHHPPSDFLEFEGGVLAASGQSEPDGPII